jgi:hypothetical protein
MAGRGDDGGGAVLKNDGGSYREGRKGCEACEEGRESGAMHFGVFSDFRSVDCVGV